MSFQSSRPAQTGLVASVLLLSGIGAGVPSIAAESAPAAGDPSAKDTQTQQLGKISVTEDDDAGALSARSASTATGLDLSLRETPQSVTVVTRARMDAQATNDIAAVLNEVVGVNVNATSPLGSDGISFYSRGFEIKNFLIDGTPRPPAIYGFGETVSDMAPYERVEIVRGPNGLMTGVGSPSAAVNLIRKRPTAQSQVRAGVEIGSFNHNRLETDISGSLSSSGKTRGRLVAVFEDSDAFIDRVNSERKVFYGVIESELTSRTLLTAGFEYQDFSSTGSSRGGVPLFFTDGSEARLPRSSNTGAEWNNLSRETTRIFASLEQFFDNGWTLKLEAEESRPDYDEAFSYMWGAFDAVTGEGSSIGTARWAGDLQQRSISLRTSGAFQWLGREHQLTAGISYNTAQDDNPEYPGWWSGAAYWAPLDDAWRFLATGAFDAPSVAPTGDHSGGRIRQSGLYTALRSQLTASFSSILGLRVSNWEETDWNDYSGSRTTTTLTDDSGVVTPYAGLVFDINDQLSTYVSYTDIFEPQGAEDVKGDRLDPLVGKNYEIGLKGEFRDGAVNTTLALFRIEQDNFAVPIPGAPPNPNGNTPYSAEDGTVSLGFELEVGGEVLPGWQVAGGYAYAKAEDADDVALLTEVPRETFKLFSTYRLPGELQGFTVGGNLRWQGRTSVRESGPNGEDFVQDSQVVMDVMARYEVTRQISVSLNINNLFDNDYYKGLGWAHGTYETPRSFLLGLRWSL